VRVIGVELGLDWQGHSDGLPVDVVVSAFEDWTLPDRPVDAIVAFTSRDER
jgi:hypothetical protein